jgi:hypothetical protein
VSLDRRHLLRLSTAALAAGWAFRSAAMAQASDEAAVAEAVERLRQAMIDAEKRSIRWTASTRVSDEAAT